MRNYRKMGNDEKKEPLFPQWNIGAMLVNALMSGTIAQEFRALSALQPVHYHPVGKRGGSLAHQKWKRRRSAGWDR